MKVWIIYVQYDSFTDIVAVYRSSASAEARLAELKRHRYAGTPGIVCLDTSA
jgi:hypothetical protein